MKLEEVAYLNGRLMPLSEACVSVNDRGFLFGDSIYEVVRTYGGRPWALDRHMARLEGCLAAIGIGVDMGALRQEILRTYACCSAPDALIYLQITRGVAPRSHVPDGPLTPTVLITARPFAGVGPASIYEEGVSAILVPELRWARRDIKSTNLLPNILAKGEAHQRGAHEAIFVTDEGWVNEGTHSNVFIVHAGVVRTPPKGHNLLPGITRDVVVEIARREGIPMEELPVTREALLGADEVFVTGTGSEVLGVVRVDDQAIGDGRIGPMTRRLLDAYRQEIARGEE